MNLISIPALSDNYIWFLCNDDNRCLIVDPGEAKPVLEALTARQLSPVAILLTHNHQDHVEGIPELLKHFLLPVYGPEETHSKGATWIVSEGDSLTLLNHSFTVIALPGHTPGHIGFYSKPWLFCGDTVFSSGCGRFCRSMSKSMYHSVQKINQFPSETLICPAHEYTISNLDFSSTLLPNDSVIRGYQRAMKALRFKNKPSVPTTLYMERLINPFLRCHDIKLQDKLNHYPSAGEEWRIFLEMRLLKDSFK
ncbi:hydroxyacylglutathione hydrolase [Candidatus Steffania adelgidicola]|uniref:hydroxyacylglutathione hydrolase n=1 Tax=Candidatus Steffania adelgidicola TaxID=1076626 RepID=UPI001D0339D5|nr:hydroxyacylglutathione hydrolase [Candidatus Steffania adelgidicola]UDG80221.1 Hydroxyacylglutathione hydrolase [Candidatus Steffania adelgidicola]